jgi:hypothetical protein
VEAAGGLGLLLGPGLLQADWFGALGWGTDALAAQRAAGAAGWAVAAVPTLVLLAVLLRRRAAGRAPALVRPQEAAA